MRCALTTRSSAGTSSSVRTSMAACSVGKSERDPPTTPTIGTAARPDPAFVSVIACPPPASASSSQRRCASPVRARSSAASTVEPVTVRWPILRRSNTRRLSYRWRWTAGSPRAAPSAPGSSRASRRGPAPSRLTMAVGARASVEPRARPQIARMCCSNWDVRGALDRPVAAVVDARRELVDDEAAVRHAGTAPRSGSRPGPSRRRGAPRAGWRESRSHR